MASAKSRHRIILVLFSIAAAVTTALTLTTAPPSSEGVTLGDFPFVVGDFSGTDIPVEQSVKDILETPNVLMRNYVGRDGAHITVAIVYYEQYQVYFHMPEGCMTGQGSVIVASERVNVGTLEEEKEPLIANKLVLKQTEGNEHVFYFFIAGDLITASYPRMRLHLMMEHVKRRPTGAALVRFSTRTNGVSDEDSLTRLKEFIGQTELFECDTCPTPKPHTVYKKVGVDDKTFLKCNGCGHWEEVKVDYSRTELTGQVIEEEKTKDE